MCRFPGTSGVRLMPASYGALQGPGTERLAQAADLFRPGAVIEGGPEQRGGDRRVKEHPALASELLRGRGKRPGLVLAKHAHAQHPEAGLPVSEPFAQCLERPDVKGHEGKQLRFGVDVPDDSTAASPD